jgi:tagatose-1,6-bisphosphate aldolase
MANTPAVSQSSLEQKKLNLSRLHAAEAGAVLLDQGLHFVERKY